MVDSIRGRHQDKEVRLEPEKKDADLQSVADPEPTNQAFATIREPKRDLVSVAEPRNNQPRRIDAFREFGQRSEEPARPDSYDVLSENVDAKMLASGQVKLGASELSKATSNMMQTFKASGSALGAQVSGALGFEETSRRLAERSEEISSEGLQETRVNRIADIRSFQDLADYGAQLAGSQGVIIGATIASALLTKGLGRRLLPTTRELVRSRKKMLTRVRRASTPAKAKAEYEAAQAITKQLSVRDNVASAVGVMGSVMGVSAPEQASLLIDDEASGTVQQRATSSLAATTAAGALAILPVHRFLQKSGLNRRTQMLTTKAYESAVRKHIGQQAAPDFTRRSGNLLGNIMREVPKQAGIEGVSEVAQEFALRSTHAMFKEDVGMFDDEAIGNYLEALGASLIVGGALGGLGQVTDAAITRLADTAPAEGSLSERAMNRLSQIERDKLTTQIFQRRAFDRTPVAAELRDIQDEIEENGGVTDNVRGRLVNTLGEEQAQFVEEQIEQGNPNIDELVFASLEEQRGESPFASSMRASMESLTFEDRMDDAISLKVGEGIVQNFMRGSAMQQALGRLSDGRRVDLTRLIGKLAIEAETIAEQDLDDVDIELIGEQRRQQLAELLGGEEFVETAIEYALRQDLLMREAEERVSDDGLGRSPMDRAAEEGYLSEEEIAERETQRETELSLGDPDSGINEAQRPIGTILGNPLDAQNTRDKAQTIELSNLGTVSPFVATDKEGKRLKGNAKATKNRAAALTETYGLDFVPRKFGDVALEANEDLVALANTINRRARGQSSRPAWVRPGAFRSPKRAQEFLNKFEVAALANPEQEQATVDAGGFSVNELMRVIRPLDGSGLPREDQATLVNENSGKRVAVDLVAATQAIRDRTRGAPTNALENSSAAIAQLLDQGFRLPTKAETQQAVREAEKKAPLNESIARQVQAFKERGGNEDVTLDSIVDRRRGEEGIVTAADVQLGRERAQRRRELRDKRNAPTRERALKRARTAPTRQVQSEVKRALAEASGSRKVALQQAEDLLRMRAEGDTETVKKRMKYLRTQRGAKAYENVLREILLAQAKITNRAYARAFEKGFKRDLSEADRKQYEAEKAALDTIIAKEEDAAKALEDLPSDLSWRALISTSNFDNYTDERFKAEAEESEAGGAGTKQLVQKDDGTSAYQRIGSEAEVAELTGALKKGLPYYDLIDFTVRRMINTAGESYGDNAVQLYLEGQELQKTGQTSQVLNALARIKASNAGFSAEQLVVEFKRRKKTSLSHLPNVSDNILRFYSNVAAIQGTTETTSSYNVYKDSLRKQLERADQSLSRMLSMEAGATLARNSIAIDWVRSNIRPESTDAQEISALDIRIREAQLRLLQLDEEALLDPNHPLKSEMMDIVSDLMIEAAEALGVEPLESTRNAVRIHQRARMNHPIDLLAELTAIKRMNAIAAKQLFPANAEIHDLVEPEVREAARVKIENMLNEGMFSGIPWLNVRVITSAEDLRTFGVQGVRSEADLEHQIDKMFPPGHSLSVDGSIWSYENLGERVALQLGAIKDASGRPIIYINPMLKDAAQVTAAFHEAGHIIDYEMFSREDPKIQEQIIGEYLEWLESITPGGTANVETLEEIKANKRGAAAELFSSATPEVFREMHAERPDNAALGKVEYAVSFREWFADRTAEWASTDKVAQTAVEKFFKKVADFFKKLLDSFRASKRGQHAQSPALEGWLRARLRAETTKGAYALRRQGRQPFWFENTNSTASLVQYFSASGDNARSGRPLTLEEILEIRGRKSMALRSAQAEMDPNSLNANFNIREMISSQLTAGERKTLARVFNQPRIRDEIVKYFQDDFGWIAEIESQQDAFIATGYQLWKAGLIEVSPAGKSLFGKLRKQIHEQVFGEVLNQDNAVEILKAMHEGRIASRRTIFQDQARQGSHIQQGHYALNHAQVDIIGRLFAGRAAAGGLQSVTVKDMMQRLEKFSRFSDRNFGRDSRRRLAQDILTKTFTPELVNRAMREPTWRLGNEDLSAVKTTVFNENLTSAAHFLRGVASTLGRGMETIFLGQMSIARQSGNQGLIDGINMLYRDSGGKRQGRSYDQTKTMAIGHFMNQYEQLTKMLPENQKAAFRDALLQNRTMSVADGDSQLQVQAQKKYIKMMADIRKHMQDAGVDLGDRGNDRIYVPWVFEEKAFGQRGNEFKAFAMQDKFLKHWRKLAEEKQKERGGNTDFSDPKNLERFVTSYISALSDQDGFADTEVVVDPNKRTQPHVRSMLRRELDFLQTEGNAEDRKTLASYMSQDLNRNIATYINQAMKRATFQEFFGRGQLQEVEANIRAQGGGDREVRIFNNMVDMQMGTYGLDFGPATQAALTTMGKAMGKDWSNLNPETWRKAQSWIVTYQNVRLLAFSALTNVVDVAGLAVRSGSLTEAVRGLKMGFQAELSNNSLTQAELTEQAEMLGITEKLVVKDMLGQLYGGVHFTGAAAKINDFFFKYNGMMALNRYLRISALGTAQLYLKRHGKRAAEGDAQSQKLLRDIGLAPSDIVIENGQIKMLSDDAQLGNMDPVDQAQERERDNRVKNAMFRFVDEAVMRPSAMQRPGWGNDPNWGMFFHLKAFMYTYHERHLRRALSKLGEGDAGPLIWMAAFPALMFGADLAREFLQHGPTGDPWKEDWGVMEYSLDAMHRSGIYGIGTYGPDMLKSMQFGRNPLVEMAGPAVSQTLRVQDAILGGKSHKLRREAINALPASNALKSMEAWLSAWSASIEPMSDEEALRSLENAMFISDDIIQEARAYYGVQQ